MKAINRQGSCALQSRLTNHEQNQNRERDNWLRDSADCKSRIVDGLYGCIRLLIEAKLARAFQCRARVQGPW